MHPARHSLQSKENDAREIRARMENPRLASLRPTKLTCRASSSGSTKVTSSSILLGFAPGIPDVKTIGCALWFEGIQAMTCRPSTRTLSLWLFPSRPLTTDKHKISLFTLPVSHTDTQNHSHTLKTYSQPLPPPVTPSPCPIPSPPYPSPSPSLTLSLSLSHYQEGVCGWDGAGNAD